VIWISTKIEHFVACEPSHSIQENFVRNCWQLLDLSANLFELPLSHSGKNSFKKFLDPEQDGFHNLTVTSLSKDTSLVNFSRRSDP